MLGYHLPMTQTRDPLPSYVLEVLPDRLAICRLEPDQADLDWDLGEGLLSVTFTEHEVSVVCEEAFAPADAVIERGWRCLRVVGPLEFSAVGVLVALAGPLADAGVPIFALSTFDTDHILVQAADLDRAIEALRGAGHEVEASSP